MAIARHDHGPRELKSSAVCAVLSFVREGNVTFSNGKAFQLMPAYRVLHAVHAIAVVMVLDERGGMYELTERSYSYT